MATRSRMLLITAVAALAAYTGAAWIIGITVQDQLERREQQMLKDAPYLVPISHEYHRGIFGATEQATYGLGGPFARLEQTAPGAAADHSLQLTVRNVIHHGPLPGLHAVALAQIDSELIPSPELDRALDAASAGLPIVASETRMGWLGGTTTDFASSAFRIQIPGSEMLTTRAISGSVETTRDLASWEVHLTCGGGLGLRGPLGRADLGALSADVRMRRVFGSFHVGDSQLKVATVSLHGLKRPPLLLKGVSISRASTASGKYVDTGLEIEADEMVVGEVSLSHLAYGMRATHLEASSLIALTNALREALAESEPGAPLIAPAAMQDALRRYGVELLVHDPVVEIPRLDFSMPEGAFRLSARAAAHGLRREDLAGPAGILALTTHIDAWADLRIDAALLSKLVDASPRAPTLSQQLDELARQGYLKREGAAWHALFAYTGGRLTVNGEPFPPAAPRGSR